MNKERYGAGVTGLSVRAVTLQRVLVLTLLLVLGMAVAWGDSPPGFDEQLRHWEETSQQAQAGLDDDFQEADINKTKQQVQAALRQISSVRDAAKNRLEQAQSELAQLGAMPDGQDAREDEAVAELRAEVDQRLTRLAGQVTRSDRMEARLSRLLEDIAWLEQRRFRERLLNRGPAPMHLDTWRDAWANSVELGQALGDVVSAWWDSRIKAERISSDFVLAIVMPLLGLLIGWPARLWIISHLGRDPEDLNPSYARRILGAVGDGLANAVIPAAMIGLVILGLRLQGLLVGDFGVLVGAAGLAVAVYLMVKGLSRAAISPTLVAWRIVPVEPAYGYRLSLAIRLLAGVMAATGFLVFVLLRTGIYSAALDSVFFLFQTVLIATLGAWALRPQYWTSSVAHSQAMASREDAVEFGPVTAQSSPIAEQQPPTNAAKWFHCMRGALRLILVLAPVAAFIGYSRLAHFTQSRLLATAALVGFTLLVSVAARELLERFFASAFKLSTEAGQAGERTVHGMVFWSSMATNAVLLLLLACAVLLIYGLPPLALGMWAGEVMTGIEIGGVIIAPINLVMALVLVALTLILTNLLRRWLTSHVLPNTKLDYGARNSVLAGTSYLGVGIAMVLALSAFGLNFTNLALIAGALSLGIGFGLRNAVENFAAGVLLLIERPVKVGDWIVVGNTEGTVRQISVRSTEIETFDRASVIVPNSELVSTSVTNWTYKHRLARIIIKVGVAYDSNTDVVVETLLRCADQHAKVLQIPPPAAYLLSFGESSLNFELRVFIGDTDDFLVVLSDLHLAVHKAFRVDGIVMPFPQRDINFHPESVMQSTAIRKENKNNMS